MIPWRSLQSLSKSPEEHLATFDEIAGNMEIDRAAVLRDALEAYLDGYRKELVLVELAGWAYESGKTLSHEEWKATLFKRQKAA